MKLQQALCSSNAAWTWQIHLYWGFLCNLSLLGNGLSCYQSVLSMHLSKIKIVVWNGESSAITKKGLSQFIWWKLVTVHVAHRHGIWVVDQAKVRLWKPPMEEVTSRSRIDWELAYITLPGPVSIFFFFFCIIVPCKTFIKPALPINCRFKCTYTFLEFFVIKEAKPIPIIWRVLKLWS